MDLYKIFADKAGKEGNRSGHNTSPGSVSLSLSDGHERGKKKEMKVRVWGQREKVVKE